MHPHMTNVLHNLYSADCEMTLRFAIWYLPGIHTGQLNPTQIGFISADTSYLRLADTSQTRNATLMHLVSLHDVKFCVWCACFMSPTGIIRPYFLLEL